MSSFTLVTYRIELGLIIIIIIIIIIAVLLFLVEPKEESNAGGEEDGAFTSAWNVFLITWI